ncbi:MAG: hypothetical protein AAGF12_21545 [Myxococcota bacterium]
MANFVTRALARIGMMVLWGTVGCAPETVALLVELRTDLVPVDDFERIEVELYRGTAPDARLLQFQEQPALRDGNYADSVRVADFFEVLPGHHRVRVRLFDGSGHEGYRQDLLATVDRNFGVMVVITRDCQGVVCGESSDIAACLNGQCVDPSCSPDNPTSCNEATCSLDADCGTVGACGVARCVEGACLTTSDDSRCPESICLPSLECAPPQAPPPVSLEATLSLSPSHVCMVDNDGSLCWGKNLFGQLGDGGTIDRLTPEYASLDAFVAAVSVGGAHSCHLTGEGAVYCHGEQQGAGQGFGDSVLLPQRVELPSAKQVVGGFAHACALHFDGEISCWGNDALGQLGNGDETTDLRPVGLGVEKAAKLAAGLHFMCALAETGVVYCWGSNQEGQLGSDVGQRSTAPVRVPGLDRVHDIEAGAQHACAIQDGRVYCWGNNNAYQAGQPERGYVSVPTVVSGLVGATRLAAGEHHTCAVVADNEVVCFGDNRQGQLGTPGIESSPTPVLVAGVQAFELDAAASYTCARTAGELVCWGYNAHGLIGQTGMASASVVMTAVPRRQPAP